MTTRRIGLVLLVWCTALASGVAAAGNDKPAKGWFGASIRIETSGGMPWNPTLRSVRIDRVAPASPAAQKGLLPGDEVISADGKTIAGAKARELEPVMNKTVGESLRLVLRHPDGRAYEATLVAAAHPAHPAPAPK